jgi:hypothetical protein
MRKVHVTFESSSVKVGMADTLCDYQTYRRHLLPLSAIGVYSNVNEYTLIEIKKAH